MGQGILLGQSGGSNQQFIFAGGNPVFAASAYVTYDGKNFNSYGGLYGKTYTPLDWCKVSGNTASGLNGQNITITILKQCNVSVYSFRQGQSGTGAATVTNVVNEKVNSGKTFSISGNAYNQGHGIVVIKED